MTKKIVSFSPAATEIICALGLESSLVGRSGECVFPESVKKLPVVDASSPDKILLKQLAPDIIFIGNQYHENSEWIKDFESAVKIHDFKDIQLVSVKAEYFNDISNGITTIARALEVTSAGHSLIEDLHERVDLIRHKLKYMESKPTVACLQSLQPLELAGNWVSELIGIAGGAAVWSEESKKAAYVDWEDIQLLNADILLLMPRGFSISHTLKEIVLLLTIPGFGQLSAVKNKRIYIVDGKQFFSTGPRIVDCIEILAEILHPKQFIFGYEGTGWIKFDF